MNHTKPLQEKSLQHIAILRALGGLGDLLCAVPALRALRVAYPQAHITLIGLPQVRHLVERFSLYLDEFLEFPGFPGLPERSPQIHNLPAFFAIAQARRFDLALQLHGSGGLTNPIAMMLGARMSAGFYRPGEYCPSPRTFLPFVDHESEVRRYLRLLDYLGIAPQGDYLDFPVYTGDRQDLADLEATQALVPGEYVCIHPGASVSTRRWSPAGFAAIADALAHWGLQVVLTGSAQEIDLTEAIADLMHYRSINLAGQTSLGAMAALLQDARLLVCNDTGVSHLAAALQTPSVVVFSDSDPQRWAPLDRERHRVVQARYLSSGKDEVKAAVLAQAEQLLQQGGVYAAP